jgi:hypothetical protein
MILMRYSIDNAVVKRYGFLYRPYDGQFAWVHPDAVQKRRDKGWSVVTRFNNTLVVGEKESWA